MDLQKMMDLPGALAALHTRQGRSAIAHAAGWHRIDAACPGFAGCTCVADLAIAGMEARVWEAVTGQADFCRSGLLVVGWNGRLSSMATAASYQNRDRRLRSHLQCLCSWLRRADVAEKNPGARWRDGRVPLS